MQTSFMFKHSLMRTSDTQLSLRSMTPLHSLSYQEMCACVPETRTLQAHHKYNCRYTPHSYEVGILRACKSSELNQLWQLTLAANTINNAVDSAGQPKAIHLETLISWRMRWDVCMSWIVNYLQVHDLMLVHYTWCYKHIIAWNCIRI